MKKSKKLSYKALEKAHKELANQLDHKNQSIRDAQNKIYDLEHKKELSSLGRQIQLHENIGQGFVDKLMEIIRWQINPSTANHPYRPSKSEMAQREIDQGRF